jgi:predicted O-linked N-acetylglucosamine transferase (SPINDLY family)
MHESAELSTRSVERFNELLQQALAFHQTGHLAPAQRIYEEILAIHPDNAEALHLLGIIAYQTQNHQRAVELIDRAVTLFPDNAAYYSNRGLAQHGLKKYNAAIASYDRAITINPHYAEAWYNRGLALQELKQLDAATASYEKAIELKADYAEAFFTRGLVMQKLKKHDEAVISYDRAIAIKPDYAEAWSSRGNALIDLKQHEAALICYEKAIALKPDYAVAWTNRGNALQEIKQYEAAKASYDKAIEIDPDYAEAWFNRGIMLSDLKELDAASGSYEKALALNPAFDFLPGMYLNTKMMICDWTSFYELTNQAIKRIVNDEKVFTPGQVSATINTPAIIKQASLIYAESKYPLRSTPQDIVKRPRRDKIRIGYYSADYQAHATMLLMAELFEKHDRSTFEIIAFSFGPEQEGDDIRNRVVSSFDQFIDVRAKTDQEVAALSRELEIDIAVDLKGFTKDCRTDIFSFRAAPIQVNYLGYPGTMGAVYMDYIIADPILIPEHLQQFYTEKIVYLPDSYQVNDAKRQVADKVFTRQELGLPTSGFVFCCFNNNYKITPGTFDCWMRILKKVEGSVLWLFEDNSQVSGNLRREAARRGVDAGRLVFAGRTPLPEHLARHRSADLFLDTLPCNAHTTASDAIWTGLPVLTLIGETFAGRVAASILNAVHLPELITSSEEEYEALAIELALEPEKLDEIKLKLDRNRLTAPLFDIDLYTRHIETAYREMYDRYHLDLPPDHIYVRPDASLKLI